MRLILDILFFIGYSFVIGFIGGYLFRMAHEVEEDLVDINVDSIENER